MKFPTKNNKIIFEKLNRPKWVDYRKMTLLRTTVSCHEGMCNCTDNDKNSAKNRLISNVPGSVG